MKRAGTSGLACETWGLLFELLMTERPRVPALAAELGLTPAQCHALRLIEPGLAVAMGRLAQALSCDASNITGIVDRLEARGLIERRSASRDRRIKELALTQAGVRMRETILHRLTEPPEAIASLSPEEHEALRRILRRALGKPEERRRRSRRPR
jgi:MarR family transcriptional regulator, organic hydroperoxide resistance regulator